MDSHEVNHIKEELLWRRNKIQETITSQLAPAGLAKLLEEVDSALERIENGTYGICIVCNDPVEPDRLKVNPLITVCLDHLNKQQQRELEADISLAQDIQQSMLPQNNRVINGWEVYYHYEPASTVSGDYCDIVNPQTDDKSIYLILGDVSGKGIAASMLMTHMRAMFHSLIPMELPINKLVDRASRILCESTTTSHYATLLCIKAEEKGNVEICNAGHCFPLLINKNGITQIKSTGMPIGIFCETDYNVVDFDLSPGDMLLFYTDGLSEAFRGETMFGTERIEKFAEQNRSLPPKEFVENFGRLVEKRRFNNYGST